MAIYKMGSTENTDKNTRVMEPLSSAELKP
jgi:hypothetical protein